MTLLALPLALLAGAGPATVPEILLATASVDRRARVVEVRTVVAAPAARALERRYRTSLRYRCDGVGWRLGSRTAPGTAGEGLRWRYPAGLSGRRCALEVRVQGAEGSAARRLGSLLL